MLVENRRYPLPDQMTMLTDPEGADGPIVMVNLLKFRAHAEYPDGRDAHLTGRQAYERYAVEVVKLVEGCGGRVVFAGDVRFLWIGEVGDMWDEVALAEYPSRAALMQMAMSPEMQVIGVHREAGLEGQLNIATTQTMPVRGATAR